MSYMDWAQAHARGMEAAASLTAERRAQRQGESVAARARGAGRECGIKGCARRPFKGKLCRAHWQMVPYDDKARIAIDGMIASHEIARRAHARLLRELQARLTSEAKAARGEKVSR